MDLQLLVLFTHQTYWNTVLKINQFQNDTSFSTLCCRQKNWKSWNFLEALPGSKWFDKLSGTIKKSLKSARQSAKVIEIVCKMLLIVWADRVKNINKNNI